MTDSQSRNTISDGNVDPLSDSLRWALSFGAEPDQSPLGWMAIELDPEAANAAEAVIRTDEDPRQDLGRLCLLKSGFKTLRVSGEDPEHRRLAARFYAATIAAGVVRHRRWITSQRPERALTAIRDLQGDQSMPAELRDLASGALQTAEGHVIYEPSSD